MRIQRPIKGFTRKHYSTAVIAKIEKAIERECVRYGVSRSFVIANALAFVFKIDAEKYNETEYNQKSKELQNVVQFRKKRKQRQRQVS